MSLLVMNSLYNEKGKWPVPINVWSGGKTFTPCAPRKIIFQKENLNLIISSNVNSLFYSVYLVFFFSFLFLISCFLLPICLPYVICGKYVTRINAESWHIARQTFLLALFTFARIACLLKLWILVTWDVGIFDQVTDLTGQTWLYRTDPMPWLVTAAERFVSTAAT